MDIIKIINVSELARVAKIGSIRIRNAFNYGEAKQLNEDEKSRVLSAMDVEVAKARKIFKPK